MPGLERGGDGGLIDDPAPGDVEDDRSRLEPGELLRADEPASRASQRDVHGDDVGALQQLPQLDRLDAVVGGLLRGHVRVVTDDDHLHGLGTNRDRLADLAQPDDPDRPAAQLQPRELAPVPFAGRRLASAAASWRATP